MIITSSCNEFQKAIKSEDIAVKFVVGTKMYEAEKYGKAIRLFDQIAPAYKGKPQAEQMFYMYAQALYKTKQYYLAGYQFESFVSSYPKSEKVEECAFLGAKCFSELSPVYTLDQVDTYKAIEKLQNFIDRYSESANLPEANILVKKLSEKLEKKAYENAKIYNNIGNYKAAIVAMDNFVINFPGTSYKEKALFYKLDSAYKLAINSSPLKMEERLNKAKSDYMGFIKYYSESKYKLEADDMLARIENDLRQFSK